MKKLHFIDCSTSVLIRDAIWGHLAVQELMTWTAASLSQKNRRRFWPHWGPQTRAANTITYNSCQAMEMPVTGFKACSGAQSPLNQWPWKYAPYPKAPETSVKSSRSGAAVKYLSRKKLLPFHCEINVCHI